MSYSKERDAAAEKCIECKGSPDGNGYGRITVNGRRMRAHRYAYEAAHGPIPKGMFVCHHCDNRFCMNPAHLFLGTPKDNSQDMVKKGRSYKPTHCPSGHPYIEENVYWNFRKKRQCRICLKTSQKHSYLKTRSGRTNKGVGNPRCKLKEKDVKTIRANFKETLRGSRNVNNSKILAEQFAVTTETIRRIAKGKRWTHL